MPYKQEDRRLLKQMEAGEFRKNNGRVLGVINLIKDKYVKLTMVQSALRELPYASIRDCVNFLDEERYIHLRVIGEREEAHLCDCELDQLEAKLTGRGLRLMSGSIRDDDIEV